MKQAEDIQAEIERICGEVKLQDYPFYWHYFHLATILVEAGYPQDAIKYYNKILDRYEKLPPKDPVRFPPLSSNSLRDA